MASLDAKASAQATKLEIFASFAARIELPGDLILRVQRFIDNDYNDINNLEEQEQLQRGLPTSLRVEVVAFTNSEVVNKIIFFQDKGGDFLRVILPCLRARKVYSNDILYSQGDTSEEIFFVLQGGFTLYADLSLLIELPRRTIDPHHQAFNVPVIFYGTGSYFGDFDSLIQADD